MKKIKVGVIPAAGKGNRINDLPLTRILPKPMLPILNKPILEYVIENMKRLGVEVAYMIVGYKKDIIKEYFGSGVDWDIEIEYIEQKNPTGIAHAVGLVNNYIDEPFIVILGDDLTIAESLSDLTEMFWNKSAWAVEGVVTERDVNVLRRTCCVTVDENGKMIDIEEKPANPKSNLRGCGVYFFDPIVFDYIRKAPALPPRNEIEIINALKLMVNQGKAYALYIDGVNLNINTFRDLMEATELLLSYRYAPIH